MGWDRGLDCDRCAWLIDTSQNGDVVALGLTSGATVQHASDIFEEQDCRFVGPPELQRGDRRSH
jgi:hypothetical protein